MCVRILFLSVLFLSEVILPEDCVALCWTRARVHNINLYQKKKSWDTSSYHNAVVSLRSSNYSVCTGNCGVNCIPFVFLRKFGKKRKEFEQFAATIRLRFTSV